MLLVLLNALEQEHHTVKIKRIRLMHQKVLLKGIVHRKDQNSRGNRKQEQVSANTPAQDPHIHQIIKRYRHFQNNLAVFSSSCPPKKTKLYKFHIHIS